MVGPAIPVIIMTIICGAVGVVLPFFARGQNKQVIQVSLILTAVCCWLFWLCTYLHQLNPLIGPELKLEEAIAVLTEWGNRTKAH